ncbi:hypothetical protein OHB06_13400 [Streptomyces sp. NBC_01604]|uniref:hypothetical protein n=1 Tax=unclassified Streptomyces TaxID=2593676 RepID=UPI00386641D7
MTMQRDVHDKLRARLHEAAGTHQPDRARILARVERGMTEQTRSDHRATRPPVFGWVRVVAATTAVAGVLGVGGYAVASAVKEDTPPQRNVAVTATPSPDATSRAPAPPPDPTPSAPKETRETDTPPSRTPSASATTEAPVASGTEDGPLWSDGSVDPHSNEFWGQSNVTLKTSEKLTALTVRLKVRQTGGLTSAGAWRSAPEDDFTTTVVEEDGFLVYTWVLKPDRSVREGEWVFAGQYDHDRGGRDARDDDYEITATTGGQQRAVAGDFAAVEDDEDDS